MRLRDWTLQYNLIWAANEKPPTDCICPEGYEPYEDECRKVSTKPAVQPPDWNPMLLVEKPSNNYGISGFRIYNSNYELNGSMTDPSKYTEYVQPTEYLYWWNYEGYPGDGTPDKGPMNRCCLWTSSYSNNQSIGFSVCVNIGESKTYYVGIGVDNHISFRIDGEYFVQMPPVEEFYSFRYWHIYPLFIKKGFHVIEVIGHNVTNIAAVGIQIYDATPVELLAVTSDAELAPYLVFDSKNEIGNYHTLGDYAYPIDLDYALVLCDGAPYYREVEYTPCNEVEAGVNGKFQIAVVNNEYVMISQDYGLSWGNYYEMRAWRACAVNSDGTMFFAAFYNGAVYKSENRGLSWSAVTTGNCTGIELNGSGEYVAACIYNGYIKVSSNYGSGFTYRAIIANWNDVAVSRTGQYMVACPWSAKPYVSSDYGVTWAETGIVAGYYAAAISETGQYMLLAAYYRVVLSSDYGVTWSTIFTLDLAHFRGCSMSQTGQYMVFVREGGKIYVSSDYGVTFSQKGITANWFSVSMDASGKYITAVIDGGELYTSEDYGETWTARTGSKNYRHVAISKGYV